MISFSFLILRYCVFEMGTPVENSSVGKISPIDNVFDFGVNSDPFPSEEFCGDFTQSIADFDLSVFSSVQDSTEVHTSLSNEIGHQTETLVFTKTDSLAFWVSQIEEQLGIFYLSFWGLRADRAVEVLSSICRDQFDWGVLDSDFIVVQRLSSRRVGVLIRLSSLDLKQRIKLLLIKNYSFELCFSLFFF